MRDVQKLIYSSSDSDSYSHSDSSSSSELSSFVNSTLAFVAGTGGDTGGGGGRKEGGGGSLMLADTDTEVD